MLTIRLFGTFELLHDEETILLSARKDRWLLARLILNGGSPLPRTVLMDTLWPAGDSVQGDPAYNLRRSLNRLRKAVGEKRIVTPNRQTVGFNLAEVCVDVLSFDAAVADCEGEKLLEALALYRGPLLAECPELWALGERKTREEKYRSMVVQVATDALEGQEAQRAIPLLRAAQRLTPLWEEGCRLLMEALTAYGKPQEAIETYQELIRLLRREDRGALPQAATRQTYENIRHRATGHRAITTDRPLRPDTPKVTPPVPIVHAGRLPEALTNLIGREEARQEILARMRQSRLVTLTGVGGVGKTRLAIATAGTVAEDYAESVAFVALAALSNDYLVLSAIASALGLREDNGRPLAEIVRNYLQSRSQLLVMDNCEHLLPACAEVVANLLETCAGLNVLATSRQALGLMGEYVWRVPSLSLPEPQYPTLSEAEMLDKMRHSDAVRLFEERASAVQASFRLTSQNASAVAQLCRQLDGIPLAIELAAVRVRAMPLELIVARLDDRFRLLTGGSRAAQPRQQTLRALIDWSYGLLNAQEKALLCRLSVFAGGWSLQAAEQVCAGENMEDWDVLDLLMALLDKSLVLYEEQAGQGRYQLLETVRQYAHDRLVESGEADIWRRAHRDYFLAVAEGTEPKLHGPHQVQYLNQLEREHDNFRAALTWSRNPGQEEAGLQLAGALYWFWNLRSYLHEGRGWLDEMLSCTEAQGTSRARAQALQGAGQIAFYLHDHATARARLEQSAALWEELGDVRGHAYALVYLMSSCSTLGDPASHDIAEQCETLARQTGDAWVLGMALWMLGYLVHEQETVKKVSYFEESISMLRHVGDPWSLVGPLLYLAQIHRDKGRLVEARIMIEESLTYIRQVGHTWRTLVCLHELGLILLCAGDLAGARVHLEESLTLCHKIEDDAWTVLVTYALGQVARRAGSWEEAHSRYSEALRLAREQNERVHHIARILDGFGVLAQNTGRSIRAARLLEAAEVLRSQDVDDRRPYEREEGSHAKAHVRTTLGEDACAVAWAQGRSMTMDQAVAYALS